MYTKYTFTAYHDFTAELQLSKIILIRFQKSALGHSHTIIYNKLKNVLYMVDICFGTKNAAS